MTLFRTDKHNNPTAFTTEIARQAGLVAGKDYVVGDPFDSGSGHILYTARLIGDAIAITIKTIDKIGFYNSMGKQRWIYICMPNFIWNSLNYDLKVKTLGFMYQHEGGTELKHLFASGISEIGVSVGDKLDFGDKIG